MSFIDRQPKRDSRQSYDVIVVGGGIYGAMLALEASRRGLRALVLEKEDFGGATSFNSLRILHGGLRYLQTLDLPRFFESVNERRWFLKTFPDLVKPLPCLMPLYGEGVKRPLVLNAVLRLNDMLSRYRNRAVRADRVLPSGTVLSNKDVISHLNWIDPRGLRGAALWYDASMPDSHRLIIEVLRWACRTGATALNYAEAIEVEQSNNAIQGVVVKDKLNGSKLLFRARAVVNAAGPWAPTMASQFDRDYPGLFAPSLAWNILFDRKIDHDVAVALTPRKAKAQTYFLHPWKEMMLIGTGHAPWSGRTENPVPDDTLVNRFVENVNLAAPGLQLKQDEILRVYSGLLPARRFGTAQLSVRPKFIDHGASGGLHGLYSIVGVKFTTSRAVAAKTLNRIFPRHTPVNGFYDSPPDVAARVPSHSFAWVPKASERDWLEDAKTRVRDESVQHIDDLLFRRTDLGDNPYRALKVASMAEELFDWDGARFAQEKARVERFVEPFVK